MGITAEQARALGTKAGQQSNQNLHYRPSYPLDEFLWLDNDKLDELVDELASRITANEERRERDPKTKRKFLYGLKVLLLNLLLTVKLPRKTLLAVKKGSGDYTEDSRYDSKWLAYKPFIDAYEGLLNLELITETKGHWDKETKKGKVTRTEPSPQFKRLLKRMFPEEVIIFTVHPDKETLVLKDEDHKLKDYKDTDFTKEARANLQIINGCLNRHWFDLDMTEEEFKKFYAALQRRHRKDENEPATVNYMARSLYRVFNNSTFEQGGRFYGGWWEGIPSDYRKYITINQKGTVEIDYSGFHPRMLYALEKMDMGKRDPYVIKGIGNDRDLGKVTFTKLLNGDKHLRKPDEFNADKVGMSWKEFLKRMEEYHEPIKHHFRKGYGLELQRIDSDIAEKVLLHFSKRDIPCLPIHDSFIIHHALRDELQEVMEQEYRQIFELDAKIKLDDYFEIMMNKRGGKGEILISMDELIQQDLKNEHERRWMSWLNQTP